MSHVNVNGSRFEYIEEGSGDPLVLVHGSASDYRTWKCQVSEFSHHFHTIAYSRRFHWPNEEIAEGDDYSMSEHVDDLQALLRSVGAAPAHLVGHSYGAFLCLLLAIREPSLVRSLVLAEPPAITLFVSDPPRPSEILRLLVSIPRTALSIIKFGAKGVNPASAAARQGNMDTAMEIFGKAVLGSQYYNQLSTSRLEQVRANAIKAEFLGSGFAPLEERDVCAVQVPALLLAAEQSPALFRHVLDQLHELLPCSKRIEIAGASHIMHEDNSSDYNAAVLSFLMGYGRTAC